MKVRQGPARAALLSSLVSAVAAAAFVSAGHAATAATATPPYEPDANAAGTITFYDPSGAAITSGSTTALVGYAVGSAALTSTGSKASLYGYLPKSGQVPGAFSGELLSGPTTYPIAGAPAPVSGSANPAVKPLTGDVTFAQLAADFPNTATDAYQGLYQIRIKTTDTQYLTADIKIAGGTWSEVYPSSGPAPTATPTPTSTPSSGPVTLSADLGTIFAGRMAHLTVHGTPGAAYNVFAANRPSSTFAIAHQGTLDTKGNSAAFEVHPLNNVVFIAHVGSTASNQINMAVHTLLNFTAKGSGKAHQFVFSGQIYPNNRSQAIYIGTGRTNLGRATRDASGKNWRFVYNGSASAGKRVVFYSFTASDTQNANGHSANYSLKV
jgi:hypothetical protein